MIDKEKLRRLLDRQKVIIELGPGNNKRIENSITIDVLDLPDVDIVADLNDGLEFLPDNSVDRMHSHHVLEHIVNFGFLMKEIHRVLKPGGMKIGRVPHFSNPYFFSDYTHTRFFGLYSFSYFSKKTFFKRTTPTFYSDIDFEILDIKLVFMSQFLERKIVKRITEKIFNINKYFQELYEENFCYFLPAYELYFVLRKPVRKS
jgi:ubiquinone/menaquinone biosynthesis C-methylase UbiE